MRLPLRFRELRNERVDEAAVLKRNKNPTLRAWANVAYDNEIETEVKIEVVLEIGIEIVIACVIEMEIEMTLEIQRGGEEQVSERGDTREEREREGGVAGKGGVRAEKRGKEWWRVGLGAGRF